MLAEPPAGELEELEELEEPEVELLPGLAGGDELGVEGLWGCGGLLAEGQPANSRHRHASPANLRRSPMLLLHAECFDNFFSLYSLPRFETGAKFGFTQLLHQPDSPAVLFFIAIQAFQVDGATALGYPEF